jgi:hypothetical protein
MHFTPASALRNRRPPDQVRVLLKDARGSRSARNVLQALGYEIVGYEIVGAVDPTKVACNQGRRGDALGLVRLFGEGAVVTSYPEAPPRQAKGAD